MQIDWKHQIKITQLKDWWLHMIHIVPLISILHVISLKQVSVKTQTNFNITVHGIIRVQISWWTILANHICWSVTRTPWNWIIYIELNMSVQYCQESNLVVNTKKSQQMITGRKKDKVLQLPKVQRIEEGKYLDIILDVKQSWIQQTKQLCKKA